MSGGVTGRSAFLPCPWPRPEHVEKTAHLLSKEAFMPVFVWPDVDRIYFRQSLGMCVYTLAVGLYWLAVALGF